MVVLEWHLVCPCTLNECSLILTRLPFPFFLFDFESTVTCVDNFIYRFLPHVTKRPSFRNFVSFKTENLTLRAWISPRPSAGRGEMIIFKIKWINYRFWLNSEELNWGSLFQHVFHRKTSFLDLTQYFMNLTKTDFGTC